MLSIAAFPASSRERLATPVSEIMRPGVITIGERASLLQAKREMVRHGVHAVLVAGTESGDPLVWVSADGLLGWLERDLSALPASRAITEAPHFIEPDAIARYALRCLRSPVSPTCSFVQPKAGCRRESWRRWTSSSWSPARHERTHGPERRWRLSRRTCTSLGYRGAVRERDALL
jgi:hypothetical protein